jgi:hypothetical protein
VIDALARVPVLSPDCLDLRSLAALRELTPKRFFMLAAAQLLSLRTPVRQPQAGNIARNSEQARRSRLSFYNVEFTCLTTI